MRRESGIGSGNIWFKIANIVLPFPTKFLNKLMCEGMVVSEITVDTDIVCFILHTARKLSGSVASTYHGAHGDLPRG